MRQRAVSPSVYAFRESEENMGTWKEYIENLKSRWIGKSIEFESKRYKVVDVDYNGILLIDRRARFTETTAVAPRDIEEIKE